MENSIPLRKILYAEDEVDIKAIAQIALEDIGGFLVHYCENGEGVLDTIESFQPDLLLLDVMMPVMDGPTTLRAVRNIRGYENIPTIFMTAKIQPTEITEYRAMGVIEVISKPFDPMILSETIQKVWDRHHAK